MKITKTYRFEAEIIKHAEQNAEISSFSEWACNVYRKQFLDLESKKRRLQELQDLQDKLEQEIKDMQGPQMSQNKTITGPFLTERERSWLQTEAKSRLERGTFEGVYRFFTNHFGRIDKDQINRRQFKILVERYSEK